MWNEMTTNGANGANGAHGAYGYELPHAEAATAPHPVHRIAGDGPSRLFLDPSAGAWVDRELTRLSDLPPADVRFLQDKGIITTPVGTPSMSTFRVRLKGRLVVPRDLATRSAAVPIVFIVMGNHNAFEPRPSPSTEVDEVDSYDGYDYLQQALADAGVASCSVDTNFANALNLGIRARAEITLDTIALIRARTPAAVLSKLDFQKVGLVGHSRGGEAVVMAALLAAGRSLTFRTRCVASIAPTDFSSTRTGRIDAAGTTLPVTAPLGLGGSLRYLVLLGAHDGDVAEPSHNGFTLYDRASCDKTLVFARGLTHNRFNTVWDECADYADGRHVFVIGNCRSRAPGTTFDRRIFAAVVHREYAKFFVGALVKRTLLGDATVEDTLRGVVAPTRAQLQQSPGAGAGPAASVQWSVTSALTVDEFDSPGIGARGPAGISVVAANSGRPSVPHATASFIASSAGNRVRVEVGGRDLSARRELTFRLTSMVPITSEATIAAARSPDWEVRLVTSRGASACRPAHLDRRGLRDPNKPFFSTVNPGPANVTKNQFDTLVVPLSAFANADLRDVRAIEFEARGGELPLIVDSFAFV